MLIKILKNNSHLILVLAFASLFSFVKLGEADLSDWDESRNGVNAFEMMHNGDYFNFYFADKPDTWNNKPPLFIWTIILSYKIFGFNVFALRFPSTVSTVVFFFFLFRLITLYKSKIFATLCCLILISCKGIIGHHVGRTGDFDAILLMFETAGVFYFLKFVDFNKPAAAILCSIAFALAFWVKGTAVFLIFPALFLYILSQKLFKKTAKSKFTWIGIIILISVVSGYFIFAKQFSVNFNGKSVYKSKNAVETMLLHDTYNRMVNPEFNPEHQNNHTYFFTVLDAKLNLWNYLFYFTMTFLIFRLFISKKNEILKDKLLVLSLLFTFSIGIILTLSENKNVWYLTPALPFIAIIISSGIVFATAYQKKIKYVVIALLAFTLTRHFIFLLNPENKLQTFLSKNNSIVQKANSICIVDLPAQSMHLYLKFSGKKIVYSDRIYFSNRPILIVGKDKSVNEKKIGCYKDDCLFLK